MIYAPVSVIIPTFNRAKYLAESVESVLGQTLPPRQLIIINDGSTDDTRMILEKYRRTIEYIETDNRGKASALNHAMPRISGKYVWIMDDDDVALPDALSRHVEILEQRRQYGWTYSSFINSTNDSNGRIVPVAEKLLPEFPEDEFLIRLMEHCFLIHPTIVVRTSCYREVGPFQADLVRCQDYEMAIRLARRYRSARVVGPTIYHRNHGQARGSAQDTFGVEQIYVKWLEYMQVFFRHLRREMALNEYLPRSFATDNKDGLAERRAYLQRMAIMAAKRLIDEMIEDLRLAKDMPAGLQSLSAAECLILRRVFCSLEDPPLVTNNLMKRIRTACSGQIGMVLRREFAHGLYWRACHAYCTREYGEMFRAISAAINLVGFRDLTLLMSR